ncbi:hypothetical protein PC116_g19991 [Phytophthora cactorum]|nr:hypothetical protein PC114_g17443 [Phytophthora cactorum]KAG3011382.1 hypothetical protein PC120_g14460 [Phytophthora cactorum]KAG4231755.1 hypothetical protein PC116_g19991 [Phytophthora cactorum]
MERERYDYFVPMVERVCKKAFQAAYGVSNNTLAK